jgi:hypothetical protein
MPIALAPFDPSRDFEARTFLRAAGRNYRRHDPFDKSTVSERLLRQLYEQRKIASVGGPPKPKGAKRMAKLLGGFVASVLARRNQDTEGASGTAREAPGAEESTSATSGSASAPQDGGGGPEPASPDLITEAEAKQSAPASSEAAAAPAGDSATVAADSREARIDALMIAHSQKQLLELAKDLPGVSSKTPKATAAALLVDAGLAG